MKCSLIGIGRAFLVLAGLVSAVCSQTAHADYAATILADNPVGYWRLGETGSTTAADSSGNGYTATAVGTTDPLSILGSVTPGAIVGDADKAAHIAEYGGAVISDASVMTYDNTTDAYTLEAWIKLNSAPAGLQTVMSLGNHAFMGVLNVGGNMQVLGQGGTNGYQYSNDQNLNDGAWHMINMVHTPGVAASSISMYLDGNLLTSTDSGGVMDAGSEASKVHMFYRYTFGDAFFVGSGLDEVALYNTALSAGRIAAHYNAGVGLSPQQPGDFDGDGDVDGADFVAWQTHFPTASGAMLADGDADGDGDVDGADFVVWQTNFPFTPGSGAAPVPEPAALTLMLLSAGAITLLRRGLQRKSHGEASFA